MLSLFEGRRQQQNFFKNLYAQGIISAKRRYGDSAKSFDYQDAVHESILYVHDRMKVKNFSSLDHLRRYFWVVLRGNCNCIFTRRREVSLNCSVGDRGATIEDFIAARITYPSLEDEETKGEIEAAVNSLPENQRELVYLVWVDGRSVKEIKGDSLYLQRLLDNAKLRLARRLISRKKYG
jgi:DNA-directed RNA polymerase specialized sigma24 family protein